MKKQILLLSIPLVIIIFYIFYHYFKFIQSNELVYFPITGYDPRNILSGHYIQFKVQQNQNINCNIPNEILCGCIQFIKDKNNLIIGEIQLPLKECKNLDCKPKIQLQCINNEFMIPHTKFYLTEKAETIVPIIPENSYILLKIDFDGKSYINNIFIYEENSKTFLTIYDYIHQKESNKNK